MAKVVVGFGEGIKIMGMIVALVIAIAGYMGAQNLGTAAGVASGIFGAVLGAMVYIFGVLIAAQGQLQYAVLDVAVNSSPALSTDVKTKLVVDSASATSSPDAATDGYASDAGI